MQATIVDLRHHMRDVLSALSRNEQVSVSYHGKKIATMIPLGLEKNKKKLPKDHPFFGMFKAEDSMSVEEQMEQLRGGRYRDI